MPEGPEVKIVAMGLAQNYRGYYLRNLTFNQNIKQFQRDTPQLLQIQQLLQSGNSLRIDRISSYGKKILFQCCQIMMVESPFGKMEVESNQPIYFINSLCMSGHWIRKPAPVTKHCNLSLSLSPDNSDSNIEIIYFEDSRHFGIFNVAFDSKQLLHYLKDVGPDLMYTAICHYLSFSQFEKDNLVVESPFVTLDLWISTLRKYPNKQICQLLMNQCLSGIGNYLKAEILYACRIRPDRLISSLSDPQLTLIYQETLRLMFSSYQARGLTIESYFDLDGQMGHFQVKVYQKHYDPEGHPVRTDTFKDDRTTHWVPTLQS